MKIAIFGTGYVGLVAGACLAESGNSVTCLDVDKEKIEGLKKGKIPIFEPGLGAIVKRNAKDGRLIFSTNLSEGVKQNDVVMIAVGTPAGEGGEADLRIVFSVAETIGKNMNGQKVIIQKSTVPVGTGKKIKAIVNEQLKKRKKEIKFAVVSNPEFLKEGSAVNDFLKPDRIIVGSNQAWAAEIMRKIYSPFMKKGYRLIEMNRESAELTKYAANSMLATRISFINLVARLAEKVGADISDIRRGLGSDKRIGKDFLYASVGYGGSCFPKDVKALIKILEENEVDNDFFCQIEKINHEQREWFWRKIVKFYGDNLKDKTLAIWGLAFKAQTDDVRDSSALDIVNNALAEGVKVRLFDPEAQANFQKAIGKRENVYYAKNQTDALKGADALVILTEWMQFRSPDFELIKKELSQPVIFDGRNLYDPSEMKQQGFEYFSVGRQHS